MIYAVVKRVIDVVISLSLLIFLAPFLALMAICIKCSSSGTVFYKARRMGRNGKVFEMFKFRTMISDADKKGPWFTSEKDARITPIGSFLRKYSIDELPQLFNVLLGDMSLIGPRPYDPKQREDYSISDFEIRHSVLPGITGLSQVSGRSLLTIEKAIYLDKFYAQNYSFLLDIKIIYKTIYIVFASKGSW